MHRALPWLLGAAAAPARARRRPWAARPSTPCRGGKGGGLVLGLTAPGVVGNGGSPRLLWRNTRKLRAAPASSLWPRLRAPVTWTHGRWMSERQRRSTLRETWRRHDAHRRRTRWTTKMARSVWLSSMGDGSTLARLDILVDGGGWFLWSRRWLVPVETRQWRRTGPIGTTTPITVRGAVGSVGVWHWRALRPPTGGPGWKKQFLIGGAAPK
jgi:hypothetical protein